jgi:GT2 family glycosyltransferase
MVDMSTLSGPNRVVALVLSVDEAPLLRHCLAAAAGEGADLVVIDNACTDDTLLVAAEFGATVVTLPERASYAAAMNAGLAAVNADAVLLLNADCFLNAGFLAAALPHLADPSVGSVAPKLLRVAGPDAEPDAIDAAGAFLDRRRKNGLIGHGAPISSLNDAVEVFGADGACALYRKQALGEFDPDMALWATDVDIAWRARNAGWRCIYEPLATARHIRTYPPSKRGQTSEAHRRIQFRNRYLMMVRNETLSSLLRNLPWILAYEVLALGHVLLRERFLARGYVEAARLVPRVWSRRASS